jgi:pre-mRNA-processing factor 40
MDIYPLLKDKPEYNQVIAQPGSTPLELFWDIVEDLNDKLYYDRKVVSSYFEVRFPRFLTN